MRRVKWGVLSCAAFARSTAVPAMAMADNVEIAAVASRDKAKAEDFAREFDILRAYGTYEELLADAELEAIYIPLPNGMHAEWTLKAIEAGKHVLVEKPFASNAAEAERVDRAARKSGKRVMEAFMWRYHPAHLRARELIRNGALGEVKFVRSAFTFMLKRAANVRLEPDLAGGGIMDVGCYCISASRFLLGTEPSRVFVSGDIDPEYGVDLLAAGVMEFPNGRATFDAGMALPYRCDYEVVGTFGRIIVPGAFLPPDPAELILETDHGREVETYGGVNQWSLEFQELSASILEERPPAYDTEDAVKQQRAVDAVLQSLRSGRPEVVASGS